MATEDDLTRAAQIVRLFEAYGAEIERGGEKMQNAMANCRIAVAHVDVRAVEKAVDDFIGGRLKRKRHDRVPHSAELGAHARAVAEAMADGTHHESVEYAPPFGPLWGVRMYELLGKGPDVKPMQAPTAFIAKMIAEGGEIGRRYELEHQANNGFRAVNGMLLAAADAKGCYVSVDLKPHTVRMEPVPVEGTTYIRWRAEHQVRGWPWLPHAGKQRVVYLPKDGADGLDRLLDALAGTGAATKS